MGAIDLQPRGSVGQENDDTGSGQECAQPEHPGRSIPGVKNRGKYQNRYGKHQTEDKGKFSLVDDSPGRLDDEFPLLHVICPWFS